MLEYRVLVGLCFVALSACSDDGPDEPDPFLGRWLLETVNGQTLPAAGASGFLGDPVVGGRITIAEAGFTRWDYCTQDPDDGHRTARGEQQVHYTARSTTEAEISVSFPLSFPVDTLRLAGDVLTWEFNFGGTATDLLRFRRIEEDEFTGTTCAFLP